MVRVLAHNLLGPSVLGALVTIPVGVPTVPRRFPSQLPPPVWSAASAATSLVIAARLTVVT